MKPLIYAIEDDAAIRELYEFSLEGEFDCLCFGDGAELRDALGAQLRLPDLILLDVMLPGDDGFKILASLKSGRATAHIPVIMVSAKGEEPAKVKGLNMGADDYIAKPFGVMELIARIKANLRKHAPGPEAARIEYKDIVIDNARHEIAVKGVPVPATRKEYDLLSMLCGGAGSVQAREAIFEKVWGESFVGETRTLDIHIRGLRKKLAEAGSGAAIKTVRGVGYMLV